MSKQQYIVKQFNIGLSLTELEIVLETAKDCEGNLSQAVRKLIQIAATKQ